MFKQFYLQVVEFFKDMRSELRKVTYPTRSETSGSTAVVLVFVVIVSFFLSLADAILVKLISRVIQ